MKPRITKYWSPLLKQSITLIDAELKPLDPTPESAALKEKSRKELEIMIRQIPKDL